MNSTIGNDVNEADQRTIRAGRDPTEAMAVKPSIPRVDWVRRIDSERPVVHSLNFIIGERGTPLDNWFGHLASFSAFALQGPTQLFIDAGNNFAGTW